MDVSRDTAFQLRMGAPEDMLVTFDGLKRPVGVALQAIFAARHAASTQYWADVVNTTCHTIDDLRAVMARRVPPPQRTTTSAPRTGRSRWATMKGPCARRGLSRAWA